jgi:hypothetical protein
MVTIKQRKSKAFEYEVLKKLVVILIGKRTGLSSKNSTTFSKPHVVSNNRTLAFCVHPLLN